MIVIRAALRPADTDGILSVVAEAFADNTRDASEELDIVRGTWAACDAGALLELVADDGGAVVAHALAAGGRLGARTASSPAWRRSPPCASHPRTRVAASVPP